MMKDKEYIHGVPERKRLKSFIDDGAARRKQLRSAIRRAKSKLMLLGKVLVLMPCAEETGAQGALSMTPSALS